MPEISVLMSVFNGEAYLREAIDSVLTQTFQDFELLIVDDGSTDRTREIISSYDDTRVRAFYLPRNLGVGGALHFGLSKSTGKYIAKADADDIILPDRLQKQRDYLDQHPEISLVRTLIDYFPHDEEIANSNRYRYYKSTWEPIKNGVITPEDLAEKLYWTCCIPHTTIMATSQAMKQFGYDATLRIGEDYKLFYQMNLAGYRMGTVAEKLVRVRLTGNSTTVTEESMFWKTIYRIKELEIRRLFNGGARVFLWGAGAKGQGILRDILPDDLRIAGFIDSDTSKQQQRIMGYSVHSPDVLQKGDRVLITSQPGIYSIGEYLKQRGFQSPTDFTGFY